MTAAKKKAHSSNQRQKEFQERIGKKLMKRRKELGFTSHEDFAYEKNINRSQYGKYEAGAIDLQLSSLVKVLKAMGYTLEEFFSGGLEPK